MRRRMSRRTEEDKKEEEEEAFKCYFRNNFCPYMSVLIFVRFENIGYRTDKKRTQNMSPPPPYPVPAL